MSNRCFMKPQMQQHLRCEISSCHKCTPHHYEELSLKGPSSISVSSTSSMIQLFSKIDKRKKNTIVYNVYIAMTTRTEDSSLGSNNNLVSQWEDDLAAASIASGYSPSAGFSCRVQKSRCCSTWRRRLGCCREQDSLLFIPQHTNYMGMEQRAQNHRAVNVVFACRWLA